MDEVGSVLVFMLIGMIVVMVWLCWDRYEILLLLWVLLVSFLSLFWVCFSGMYLGWVVIGFLVKLFMWLEWWSWVWVVWDGGWCDGVGLGWNVVWLCICGCSWWFCCWFRWRGVWLFMLLCCVFWSRCCFCVWVGVSWDWIWWWEVLVVWEWVWLFCLFYVFRWCIMLVWMVVLLVWDCVMVLVRCGVDVCEGFFIFWDVGDVWCSL